MTTIYAKHEPYGDGTTYARVLDEMRICGAPTIRCVRYNDHFYALEGSHRIAAAHQLGVPVKLVELEPDAGDGLDQFWEQVSLDRPAYEFETVTGLYLHDFVAATVDPDEDEDDCWDENPDPALAKLSDKEKRILGL